MKPHRPGRQVITGAVALLSLVAVFLWRPGTTHAAGLAYDENFSVLAPDQSLAEAVLIKAGEFRKRAARELLGEELPSGVGRAIINVALSDTEDRGLTWPMDGSKRRFHKIWLTTTRERATGSTLRHEIAHLVLATRFQQGLPAWAAEGMAGLQDNQHRIDTRAKIVRWYVHTGNWPDLETILNASHIGPDDQAAYAVAASLTEFFLSQGDKTRLLRFALAGKENGWDQALQRHYGLGTLEDLQRAWQTWAARSTGAQLQTP